jgi:hypothetical protein
MPDPVVSGSARAPMAGAPHVSPTNPFPIAAKPDIAGGWRNADYLDLWCWWSNRYDRALVSRSRSDDAATQRQSRQDDSCPNACL